MPFQSVDYGIEAKQAVAELTEMILTGFCTIIFGPVPMGFLWRVERITCKLDVGICRALEVYVGPIDGAVSDINLADVSDRGEKNVADESRPIIVPEGQTLQIIWRDTVIYAVATARIQYELLERVYEEVR